jgi:hypothetical protein
MVRTNDLNDHSTGARIVEVAEDPYKLSCHFSNRSLLSDLHDAKDIRAMCTLLRFAIFIVTFLVLLLVEQASVTKWGCFADARLASLASTHVAPMLP